MGKDLSMAWVLVAAMMWGTLFSPQALASGQEMDLYLTSLRWSSVNSEGNGKTARISSETLVGPALGLRLHKHLNLVTEVMFGNPDASVTPGPSNKADVMAVNVGLDGYIKHFDVSCGTLAPYLTGGLGTINFDQDMPVVLTNGPFPITLAVDCAGTWAAIPFSSFTTAGSGRI